MALCGAAVAAGDFQGSALTSGRASAAPGFLRLCTAQGAVCVQARAVFAVPALMVGAPMGSLSGSARKGILRLRRLPSRVPWYSMSAARFAKVSWTCAFVVEARALTAICT